MHRSVLAPPYARADGYAALGLHGNPFVAEQQPGVELSLWVARPDEPDAPKPGTRSFVQLIGPRGAGKTSLLLHWRRTLPGPYHYVPPGAARWRVPPLGPLVYWDEMDRMASPIRTLALLAAATRQTTVVAGTHVDLANLARRCGLSVTTHSFAPLSSALLQTWAAQRIKAVRLPGKEIRLILDNSTTANIAAHAGASWREASVLLHVWAANQAASAARG